ncbi:hypothetical protein [Streptomyces platensis]
MTCVSPPPTSLAESRPGSAAVALGTVVALAARDSNDACAPR